MWKKNSNTARLTGNGENVWFILQQITGRKSATLSGTDPTSFRYFVDVSPRFHDVRRCNVVFLRQQRKKHM